MTECSWWIRKQGNGPMREIEMCRPRKGEESAVRRLQYLGDGTELVAWIGEADWGGFTSSMRAYSFATGGNRELLADAWYMTADERAPDPVLSPDGRFVLFHLVSEENDTGYLFFEDLARTNAVDENGPHLPHLPTPISAFGGLLFTLDGAELLAVRNSEQTGTDQFERDVARFAMATFINPPLRYEDKTNPLTGKVFQRPVYNERWLTGGTLPAGPRISATALSASGKLLAFGEVNGEVHVARRKVRSVNVIATFTPPKRKPRPVVPGRRVKLHRDLHRVAQIAFSPDAKRVAWLANGQLFARPLDGKSEWQTDAELDVTDFAFHPGGKFLCTVGEDGLARYLATDTGAVTQAFKWAKRAKNPRTLYSVCFTPDGLTCAAGGENGKVVVWDVDA